MNLNQVTIPVKNMELSIQFYERLGLKLIVKSLPHYTRFVCPIGDATFSLHHVEEVSTTNGPWIYFEVADVDKTVEVLIGKGFIFDEPPTDKSWLWREAKMKDPDCHQLIIYTAGVNRLYPPWRIS